MIGENNSSAKPRQTNDNLIWFTKQRANKIASAKPRRVCIKDTGLALMGVTIENWGIAPEVK